MPLLELDAVSMVFGRHRRGFPFREHDRAGGQAIQALVKVSLTINQGQSLGIVGESGAGKSTLATLAAGLLKPTAGRVLLQEKPLEAFSRRESARILQLIWQDVNGSLDPLFKVGDAVAEPLRIHGLTGAGSIDQQVARLFREAGLHETLIDRYPNELSGGEQQRVVIARSLALSPQILICDEPASALDVRKRQHIAELLMRLRTERRLAYVIISHDLVLVKKMTEDIAVMYSGAVVERGPTAEVLKQPLHPYSKLLVESDPSLRPASAERDNTGMPDSPKVTRERLENGRGGCAFASRCPDSVELCQTVRPPLAMLDGGREVACHTFGPEDRLR